MQPITSETGLARWTWIAVLGLGVGIAVVVVNRVWDPGRGPPVVGRFVRVPRQIGNTRTDVAFQVNQEPEGARPVPLAGYVVSLSWDAGAPLRIVPAGRSAGRGQKLAVNLLTDSTGTAVLAVIAADSGAGGTVRFTARPVDLPGRARAVRTPNIPIDGAQRSRP